MIWNFFRRQLRQASESAPKSVEVDYELIPFDGQELGRGYVLRRVEDDAGLKWDLLEFNDSVLVSFVVAAYHRDRPLQRKASKPPSALRLVREPDNQDNALSPNAIAVLDKNASKIGYIPPHVAKKIAPRLDAGEQIRCLSVWEMFEGRKRVDLWAVLIPEGVTVGVCKE